MSLIADALKTAQREKQRRESGGALGDIPPVLVPLRTKPQPSYNWRTVATMGVSVLVTIGAVVFMVQRMKDAPPLSALPVAKSPLPSVRAPGVDNSSKGQRAGAVTSGVSASRPVDAPGRGARQPSAPAARGAASGRPTSPESAPPNTTVLQGDARADSVSRASPTSRPANSSAGRLRIAVEQPTHIEAHALFTAAIAAHRADDLPTARALYERVLLVAPSHADALNNLGVLLSGQREFDRALALLRRAASIEPRNAGTWNNIGTTLREQGRGSDAVAAFRHALTLDPQHQGAKVGLAQQYLAIGSVTNARTLLEDVLALNPVLPEAHYALGQALELQGDRLGAIQAYSAFIRLAPVRLAGHVERTRRHVDSLSARTR
jgi:Tfp pilus assembly protein PilF